ncbi:MAG TPA: hypothetical protein VJ183_19740 [Chloroflexia bacterium]|nr:hypothetical protein [Chloroflexia bacterium]
MRKTQNSKLKTQNSPLALMLMVFGVYLLTMSGHTYSTDEETMLAVSRSLVERGTWAINPGDGWVHVEGADGRHYSVFGPGQSLAAVPWVAVGLTVGSFFPKDQAGFPLRLILASYNALIAAGICGLLAAAGMALGYARRASLLLGGTLAFATFLWPHSRTFFAEPVVALCFFASFYLIIRVYHATPGSRTRANTLMLLSGVLFSAALYAKVQYAIALPTFLLYLAIKDRKLRMANGDFHPQRTPKPKIAIWLGGLAVGLVPLFIYNWAIFGNPLQTGYGSDTGSLFKTPLYEGVFGLLLSPGKGLVWYALPVLLALVGFSRFTRKHNAEAVLVLTLSVTLVSFFGMFHLWWGGGSWGPRFLIPLLPFVLLPALPVIQRAMRAVGRRQKAEGSITRVPDTRYGENGRYATVEARRAVPLQDHHSPYTRYRLPLNRHALLIAAVIALGFFVNLMGLLVNFDTYVNAGEDDDTRNWSPAASPIGGHLGLVEERLKVREGLLSLLKPAETLFFKSGFSYSEGSKERRELLPRWTTGNGAIEFRPDLSRGEVEVTLRLSDNRPPDMGRAAVTILANDQPVPVQAAPVPDAPVSTDYTFPLMASPSRVEIRSDTWNPAASGAGARNEDIGVRLESISVIEGGIARRYEMVETLPVPAYYPQPRWYYNPDTQHPADLWLVYMAEAGIGRKTMLTIAAPVVLVSLLCIFFGVRGLRTED